jgi:hypothetical protein
MIAMGNSNIARLSSSKYGRNITPEIRGVKFGGWGIILLNANRVIKKISPFKSFIKYLVIF